MNNKMIFNAVEAEMRNARAALNNAARYMDAIKDVVDAIVVSEYGDGIFPVGLDMEDESIVYGLKVKGINKGLVSTMKLI